MLLQHSKIKRRLAEDFQPEQINSFDETNFKKICIQLSTQDAVIKKIIAEHGHPPMWKRKHGFETLIHIILEQQVSLASAKAALNKLKVKIGTVTPKKLLALSDEELKACYFSRQKIIYARHLAKAIINRELNLSKLALMPDEDVRTTLKQIKGIGDWTVDVYLMMVLQRIDLFPQGDIALLKSVRETHGFSNHTKEEIILHAAKWKPYRTIAAFLFWHSYLCKRKRNY